MTIMSICIDFHPNRNTSSAGFETRGKMRECHGLVDSLIYVLKCAVRPEEDNDSNDMDNKVRK